ncbi:MAG: PAS domain-containing protein [Alphaproteobacteria bacterium]|nr:PAS domain-containing protein [Alphaproteobacteria bacterium]
MVAEGGTLLIAIAAAVCALIALTYRRRATTAESAFAIKSRALAETEGFGNIGGWQWNVRTSELIWSDQVCQIFGVARASTPDFSRYLELIHPDDRAATVDAIREAMSPGKKYSVRHRIRRPDGVERVLIAQGEVRFSATGEAEQMAGICQDVTELVRLQEESAEQEKRLRRVLDGVFAFVGLISTDGTLVDANKATIEAFGLDRDAVIGKKLWDTYYWSHAAAARDGVREAIMRAVAGEVVCRDFVVRAGPDQLITIEATFGPLRDSSGRVVQVVASATDMTERVRSAEEVRKVRHQLEAAQRIANIGSWEWDFASGRLWWSDQCFRILGWEVGSPATLERFMASVHPDDCKIVQRSTRDAVLGIGCAYDHRIVWPTGEVRVVHQLGEIERDSDGRPIKMIGSTQDVTMLRQTQEELIEAKIRAETASQTKSRFLASMSHELRTPLNAIIGFSELLMSDTASGFPEERRVEYQRDINSSGKHLLGVINDILDISRIEAGKMMMDEEDVALAELIDTALRMTRPKADDGGVALSRQALGTVPGVIGDRRLFLQALLNLISNAVKFTPRDGRVDVTTRVLADGGVEIAVRDTGIGMSEADVARVGEPFLQVDGRLSRKFEGTGLGLVIAKRLIEMHGGQLKVESRLGDGTTMTIALPAERVCAPSATEVAKAS